MSTTQEQKTIEYKVEVQTYKDPKYYGNQLTFKSIEDAKTYGLDLFSRWTSCEQWRVIDQDNNVVFESNY